MHLLWLIVLLVLAGAVFTRAEPLLIAPTFLLMAALHKKGKRLFYLAGVMNVVWENYVLLGWCVFAASLTEWSIFGTPAPLAWQLPVVRLRWLYYAAGFFGCLAPVQLMASFDLYERSTDPMIRIKAALPVLETVLAFVVFSFAPQFRAPWAWVARALAFWLPK
jgi:hypothetical protein